MKPILLMRELASKEKCKIASSPCLIFQVMLTLLSTPGHLFLGVQWFHLGTLWGCLLVNFFGTLVTVAKILPREEGAQNNCIHLPLRCWHSAWTWPPPLREPSSSFDPVQPKWAEGSPKAKQKAHRKFPQSASAPKLKQPLGPSRPTPKSSHPEIKAKCKGNAEKPSVGGSHFQSIALENAVARFQRLFLRNWGQSTHFTSNDVSPPSFIEPMCHMHYNNMHSFIDFRNPKA